MKTLLTLAYVEIMLAACSSKKAETPTEIVSPNMYLVLYYSQTGATKAVAEEFQKALDANIEAIELTEAYPTDFQETLNKVREDAELGKTPEIKPLKSNLKDYEVIFLGYPIWMGTYASPIITLLSNIDLSDKKVVNFCTFGSGGLIASTNDLKEAAPGVNVLASYGVRNARVSAAPDEINQFLIRNGFLKGEVEKLEDFSEQKPVSGDEAAIFNVAVAGYPMLNAKATTVGSRSISTGTEYLFHADNTNADGEVSDIQVWVTLRKDGSAPEFTLVER